MIAFAAAETAVAGARRPTGSAVLLNPFGCAGQQLAHAAGAAACGAVSAAKAVPALLLSVRGAG